MMMLAYELHRTLEEIDAMPYDEFHQWVAFFELKAEKAEEQAKRQRQQQGAGGKGRVRRRR